MLKTRLILAAVMLGFALGGFFIHQSDMDFSFKLLSGAVAGLLFLAALTLTGITFFMLDEKGQIPHGSFVWRYFVSGFYTTTKWTPEGKPVKQIRVPERLKLCPAYWMIFIGLLGLSLAVLAAGVAAYLIGLLLVYGPPTDSDIKVLALLVALVAIVVGVPLLLNKFKKYTLMKIWWSFVALLVVGGIIALAMTLNMEKGMSAGQAATFVAIGFVKVILWIAAVIAALVGVIASIVGIIYFASIILPGVRDSLIGRLITAMYRGLCPIIPIAPAPQPIPQTESEN